MIVFQDLNILTRSDMPNSDWTDGEARYVVDDNSELGRRVMECAPNFEPVEDADGKLIDIIPLPPPKPPLDESKEQAIQQTRDWVEAELKKGMLYKDGKKYNVTREKRADLAGVILVGKMNEENGVPDDKNILRWNVSGEEHENWLYKDLCALAYTMYIFVTPTIEKQQHAEIEIKGAETYDEIQAILQDFM